MRDNRLVELTPRTFDVLQYLIENVGRIVTKDELLGQVWSGSFVEESNLPVHISKLRRSLGETSSSRFIETIQTVGYRFVAPVEHADVRIWVAASQSANGNNLFANSDGLSPNTVAVLPLENASGDPELEYLADGLTESIINCLSLVPNLKVIARNTAFRYKNKDFDTREVGFTLGVGSILTGRIRISGNELNISAELVDVASGTQSWGKQLFIESRDMVRVQEEISASVAQELQSTTSSMVVDNRHRVTKDPQSYQYYLKGKYFSNKRTLADTRKAIDCFQTSLLFDSLNVHSRAEMIECHRYLHSIEDESREEALFAIEPLLEELRSLKRPLDVVELAYSRVNFSLYWKLEPAKEHCEKALALNPNYVEAHTHYLGILSMEGRFSEAVAHLNRILQLDPLSRSTYTRLGRGFYSAGHFEKALEYLKVAIELEPADFEGLALTGAVWLELGDYEKALRMFRQSLSSQRSAEIISMIGYTEALLGNTAQAMEAIDELTLLNNALDNQALNISRIYLALGDKRRMYGLLERALKSRHPDLLGLGYDPRWKAVRNEKKFLSLMQEVRLQSTG